MNSPLKIKILVAEDQPYTRFGVIAHLASQADFEVVPPGVMQGKNCFALPKDIDGTLELVEQYKPEVVVMDIKWGPDEFAGIEAARQIKERLPHSKVILYSHYNKRHQVIRAVLEGQVDGYVLKEEPPSTLPEAIRCVFLQGLPYFVPRIVNDLLTIIRTPASQSSKTNNDNPLNEGERAVLKQIAQGESNQSIAQKLGYTKSAIKTKVSTIYQKLNVYEGRPRAEIDPRVTVILKGLERGDLDHSDLVPYRSA